MRRRLKYKFDDISLYDNLILEKPIVEQEGIMKSYDGINLFDEHIDIFHGIVTLFEIGDKIYVLGIPGINTDTDANSDLELQAAIGDNLDLSNNQFSILTSLRMLIMKESSSVLSLDNFDLSSYYVVNRVKRWKLNYLKVIALYHHPISMDVLRDMVNAINSDRLVDQNYYGIYFLDQIIASSQASEKMKEGMKTPTQLFNYLTMEEDQYVILDDQSTALLFAHSRKEVLSYFRKKEQENFELL